jgi:hypothetical protein
MADDKLSIVNQALTAAGEDPLTDMTPGSVMANAAIENYDAIVSEEIENGNWKFSSKGSYAPSLLTATANSPLKYQYQRASDDIELMAVLYKGIELDGEFFELEGRIVRCAYNSDITFKYQYRPDESLWPQRFRRIITQRLEALFLRVSERHNEADNRDKSTDIKTMVAKHTESRQRRNRPLGDGTIAQARMGQRPRRFF